MRNKIYWIFIAVMIVVSSCSDDDTKEAPKETAPVMILDTDIASSGDDLVTMICLDDLADEGGIQVAAI